MRRERIGLARGDMSLGNRNRRHAGSPFMPNKLLAALDQMVDF
jgi:hypothetical protein